MTVFAATPPPVDSSRISFPRNHLLLITLDNPKHLNALSSSQHEQLERLYKWYDAEPSLRCAILTGTGRAFCAGANLKEWETRTVSASSKSPERWNTAGFGGLSNRTGKKPIVAAVNGLCIGGGVEMVVNCDLVVAHQERARFALPEVQRGVVASAGCLPRLIRTIGQQRAAEMALLGRFYSANTMHDWGLVNFVVQDADESQETWTVVDEAVRIGDEIASNSPDSVMTTREGLRLGWEPLGPVSATQTLGKGLLGRMDGAENMKLGLAAFAARKKPDFVDSKL